jgi:hypothetical protein
MELLHWAPSGMPGCAQEVARDAAGLAREVLSGRSQAAARELSALQRIPRAASEPLIALGRSAAAALVSGLSSTTTVAFSGGLGILRLGFGECRRFWARAGFSYPWSPC